MRRRAVVLYDEDCGFCRWSADLLRRWDRAGALGFASIQSSDALLGSIAPADRLRSMHVVDESGRIWSGGRALTRTAERLPGGRLAASVGDRAPALADRVYGWAARHRTQLGSLLGTEACAVDPSRRSP
jgi:predicted DCC family thiol-disulfide oxidoreductase YuxK